MELLRRERTGYTYEEADAGVSESEKTMVHEE
jgi:hypothetical protein